MTVDAQILEQIVARVLDQLRTGGDAARGFRPAAPVETAPAAKVAAPAPVVAVPEIVTIEAGVITASVLQERVRTAKIVSISPKAVLTPSARDFLKQKRIELRRGTGAGSAPVTKAATWPIVVSNGAVFVDRAIEELQRQGGSVARVVSGTVAEATQLVIAGLSRGEMPGAVIVTSRLYEAACLANRSGQVRAAAVRNARDVAAAREQLGINVWCVEAAGSGYFEFRNLLRACTSQHPK